MVPAGWVTWRRGAIAAVLFLIASCSENSTFETAAVRLSPLRLESASSVDADAAWALFDRGTRTGWTPAVAPGNSVFLRVRLERPSALIHLRVSGSSPYALAVRTGDGAAVNGLSQARLDGLAPGWSSFPVNVPVLERPRPRAHPPRRRGRAPPGDRSVGRGSAGGADQRAPTPRALRRAPPGGIQAIRAVACARPPLTTSDRRCSQ
jgi:hypothetical protein